jgi:hypothetical protein
MSKRLTAFMTIALTLAAFGIAAGQKGGAAETESNIPALEAFHEIIYPIWHTAYPTKDIAALKSYVPQVNELAAKVYEARLPGILREKEGKWKAGLAGFKKSVEAYNAAAAGSDDQALLKAAETLHMRYETLVRVIRPVLPEMDAFHKVFYVVYHTDLPGKMWDDVRAAAPDLKAKAVAIANAQLAKRLEPKAGAFQTAAKALVDASSELAALDKNAGPEALRLAVEKVHTRYQALEKVFD